MAQRPREDPEKRRALGGGTPIVLTWDLFQKVCAALALTGGKYKACEANNVKYSTVAQTIKERADAGDDEWQELWDTSYDTWRESLEQEAARRHLEGVSTDHYTKDGDYTHTTIEYSDRLGEVLLKGHFPERYRDRVHHSGTVGLEPVDVFTNLTAKAKRAIRAIIMADLEEQRELITERRGALPEEETLQLTYVPYQEDIEDLRQADAEEGDSSEAQA